MSYLSLHPDDLPPVELGAEDATLRRKLEESIGKRFYESCDGVTQSLLISCEWYVSNSSKGLVLVINCPDQVINWRVLNNVLPIGHCMAQFSQQARIRVCPPPGMGDPFEVRVDELSMYQDSL